jgi:hypothetical protein
LDSILGFLSKVFGLLNLGVLVFIVFIIVGVISTGISELISRVG